MHGKIRCAVLGTGGIGLSHLKSLTTHPHVTLVAIAENNPRLASRVAQRFRLERVYADYQELLDQSDIDAVTIALPNHLHAPSAVLALESGKHVLLEKPMALSTDEALQIEKVAQRFDRTCMVGMGFRFNRHTQSAMAAIVRGDVGDLYHARCFWMRNKGIPRIGSWFTQKRLSGGGCLCDLGVHMLDTTLYLMQDFDVTSVSAVTHDRLGRQGFGEMNWGKSPIAPGKPFDVEDYAAAVLRLKSGRTISMEIGWAGFISPDNPEYGLSLMGDRGGLSLFPARLFQQRRRGYESVLLENQRFPYSEDRIHHFVDCIIHSKSPLVTLQESLRVQNILDALYASARNRREVKVKTW